jgi:hypothetical protein
VTVTGPAVTPVPLIVTVVPPTTKFVPVIVTVEIVVPVSPLFGEICVTVGAPIVGVVTVNVAGVLLLSPFAVVTVTVRGPAGAPAAIVKLVVSCVELVTFAGPAVTPAPLTATDVPPMMKFVPVIVTVETTVPISPLLGVI